MKNLPFLEALAEQGSEGNRKTKSSRKPHEPEPQPAPAEILPACNRHRQNNQLPLSLEEECEQGKALLAKAPKTLLHLQQFDPYGLQQTYRDEASGAELPVFAVFNLEGSNELRADIGMDRTTVFDASLNLANHLPFDRAQKFLEAVNQKALRTLSIARAWYPRVGLLAAFVVVLIVAAYLVPLLAARLPQGTLSHFWAPQIVVGGTSLTRSFLKHVMSSVKQNNEQ